MFEYLKHKGLSEKQVLDLRKTHGRNELPEVLPPSDLKILFDQIKSPLVYVLIVAGTVTTFLKELSDTLIILLAIIANTVLGFYQERKAHRSLFALKKMVKSYAKVIRNGKVITIESFNLVPSDLVVLNQGDKVPADGELISANRIFFQEAILTGESVSVSKNVKDMVFMGTIVTAGQGLMRVGEIGVNTKIGQIALKIQTKEEDTPLKKQLNTFSKGLAVVVLALTVFVFILGSATGRDTSEMFRASVALAVSAIPEGLLVALTVILAIGMQRILKRKGLVRNLVSAETLGGVTTICLDKTGTLTEGKLKVLKTEGNLEDIVLQSIVANDMDDPIVISAFEWAKTHSKIDPQKMITKYLRIDSIPFSPKDRYFTSLNKFNDQNNMIFVNGAPEFILKWSNLEKAKKEKILNEINSLTKSGARLIAFARKQVDTKQSLSDETIKQGGFEWVGLIAFDDPVRLGVSESLKKVMRAGINIVIITGDYLQTALSVANKLGLSLNENQTMAGDELARLSTEELSTRLKGENRILLFARTTPDQKSKIVESLKLNGEVVAMMGDGVNDALALKSSDIGVVVGDASDVARETADLVLLDSKFETVVAAIEEGRGIFENIRKIIVYLMSSAFNAIIAVSGAIILGFPLPVSAVQILWINLVTDGFPDLALTIDPKRKNIMNEAPRQTNESLLNGWMKGLIAIISVSSGILALLLFIYTYRGTNNLALSQTVAFLSLGFNSLFYVFSTRTLKESIWSQNPFSNRWLLVAVFAGAILQIVPIMSSSTRSFFGTVSVPINYWVLIISTSLVTVSLIEIVKIINRRTLEKNVILS
ncbi:MAG: HAD-IC family P-type ATPase [bacterium]|nr:MAG: HAD-IC family P-type ATPase [bacterium]